VIIQKLSGFLHETPADIKDGNAIIVTG